MANISKIAVGGTEYDIAGVGLIATIETTLTASKTYNVGDQFIYNSLLYKATQTIASGTAITIGSNCQLAPVVADQLSEINSDLTAITKGTVTDIKPYTNTDFVCPTDGYATCVTTNGVLNDVVVLTAYDPNGQLITVLKSITMVSGQEGNTQTLFVRKGMLLRCSFGGNGATNSLATFTSLV